jgi:hypothetical protein
MKKVWSVPEAIAEQFAANEYVAACGDSGITYKFKCTAGGGVSGNVYLETNGEAGLQRDYWEGWTYVEGDKYLGGYHACDIEHVAEHTDDFLDGYYVVGDTITPVIVWRGPKGNNTHCTDELDKTKWETAKS